MSQKQPETSDSGNRHWPKQIKEDHRLSNDLRIIYQQHYELMDAHNETVAQLKSAMDEVQALKRQQATPYPRGSGPIDSVLLGVPVQPIDVSTLVDGTRLTWDKASGTFQFK